MLSSKNNRTCSKDKRKKSKRVFTQKMTRLIIVKMKMKTKNRSHRYDINRPRPRHGHKYSKYKKYRSIMMLICIKQRVSNIWSSVHEKVMQHWDWFKKKSVAYKKACNAFSGYFWKCSSYYFSSSSLKFFHLNFFIERNHQIIRHFYLW